MAPPSQEIVNGKKRCDECDAWLPLADFYVQKRKSGHFTYTRRCRKHHARYNDQGRLKRHGSRTAARWFETWGLTVEQYMAIWERQGGACAICCRPAPGGPVDHHLHVDHDHVAGAVRGLLCRSCNTSLHILDDPVKRAAAMAYLGLRDSLIG